MGYGENKKEIQEIQEVKLSEGELEELAYKLLLAKVYDVVFSLLDFCDEFGIDVEELLQREKV
jgi:hypothetical protein